MDSNLQSLIEPFQKACNDPYAAARAAKGEGRRILGHMCTYTPEELFHAAGYFPLRILAWSNTIQQADGLLQAYACSLARSALEQAVSGDLNFIDTMLFSHTCDTIQNLTDIWKRNVPGTTHLSLSTPTCVEGEHAIRYFAGELAHMRDFLMEEGASITDEALQESIELYREHRSVMRRLYEIRRRNPESISARDTLDITVSSFLMLKEDHLNLLEPLLEVLDTSGTVSTKTKPRVLVVGSACQDADYSGDIEKSGCVVVDDDLCTGSRAFEIDYVEAKTPLESLARMYLARRPCAAKHRPGYDVGKEVLNRARKAGADGVVFLFTKFCDPWAFDYPNMRATLDSAKIPSLLVEIEQHQAPSAQFETRMAAFAEMLANATEEQSS